MLRITTPIVAILQLNRGPIAAVAAEIAPYLGAAHFCFQLRAILAGDVRRQLREGLSDAAWQFGATEGPWFSEAGERLNEQGQSDQVRDVGCELFHKWLTTDPDGSLACDELHKVVIAAIERIQTLPVSKVNAQNDFGERYISHSRTMPLLCMRPPITDSNVYSHTQPAAPISSAPLAANDTHNDARLEPASFEDMILAARQSSAPSSQPQGHDGPELKTLVPPANGTNGAPVPQVPETPQRLMPLTGLPPFPFFDMSRLGEAC